MYMYGNTLPAFTTEPLNGCLRNLVGMKCSWPGTCIKMFWPYLPRGGSRVRPNRSQGGPLLQKTSSTKATATNRIHSNDLVACVMKCCCFWFQAQIQGGAKIGHRGPLLQESSSSDRKATAMNQMYSNDLEACGKKCCYFWFHSKVKFLTRFWRLFGLSHFALF